MFLFLFLPCFSSHPITELNGVSHHVRFHRRPPPYYDSQIFEQVKDPSHQDHSDSMYPPGNKHILRWEKDNHLQKCLGRGYVRY